MAEQEIGFVSNLFRKISVTAVEITNGSVLVGDRLRYLGHTTDISATVDSIQIEHETVTEAKQGDTVGLKISEQVRKGDKVYKIIED